MRAWGYGWVCLCSCRKGGQAKVKPSRRTSRRRRRPYASRIFIDLHPVHPPFSGHIHQPNTYEHFFWGFLSCCFVRGLSYLTSEQKGGGAPRNTLNSRTNSIYFVDKKGGGVKKSRNFRDVIYGSPLRVTLPSIPNPRPPIISSPLGPFGSTSCAFVREKSEVNGRSV